MSNTWDNPRYSFTFSERNMMSPSEETTSRKPSRALRKRESFSELPFDNFSSAGTAT